MTPGQEALIEAMRLEQARIYSRVIPEPMREQRPVTMAEQERRVLDAEILRKRSEGQSIATIALRYGVSKWAVTDALRRAS